MKSVYIIFFLEQHVKTISKLFGNGKRHRDPPLRLKRLVCFGERTWIRLREVLKKAPLEKKSITRRKKEKEPTGAKAIKAHEDRGRRAVRFPLDGIRIRKWWEKENWAMVTDPENPFGDLTREQNLRIAELLKGRGKV
ncbi:hypothetical protein KAW55_08065 [bacterium]|nr:hypothetical protein [bacterium]